MKIIVEFEFPKQLDIHIADSFIFGDVLKSIPFSGVSMKVINRINDDELTFDSLEKLVCEYLHFKPDQLQLKTRNRTIVEGRQILHHIAYKRHLGSLSEIGIRYGNKNHSTVLSSHRNVINLLESDKEFKSKYQSFIESFLIK